MIREISISGTTNNVVVAKAKKTPRQRFMSALMGGASGAAGEALADAFAAGDKETLKELMDTLTAEVVKKARK